MNAVMPKTITKIEANPILSRKNSELEMLDVAAYCRVSTDDECSFWYKGRLLQRPNKLVVNRDDFFFAFAVTPHIGGFIDCDFFNQLVEHETV